MGKLFHFFENNCPDVPKKYWALQKEKIFILFSFLYLRHIRGTYSKYFQNNIYETDISFASE